MSIGHGSWVRWILGHVTVTQDPFRILMSLCPVLIQLTLLLVIVIINIMIRQRFELRILGFDYTLGFEL